MIKSLNFKIFAEIIIRYTPWSGDSLKQNKNQITDVPFILIFRLILALVVGGENGLFG